MAPSNPHPQQPLSAETVLQYATGALRWPDAPWKNRGRIGSHYKRLSDELCRRLNVLYRTGHMNEYGYSSFFGVWFYKDDHGFRSRYTSRHEHGFTGLWVLFHHATPFYVAGEGEMHWGARGGSEFLPSIESVDELPTPAVLELSRRVDRQLHKRGFIRLDRDFLRHPIPPDLPIESNLNSGEPCLFDALFFWMD